MLRLQVVCLLRLHLAVMLAVGRPTGGRHRGRSHRDQLRSWAAALGAAHAAVWLGCLRRSLQVMLAVQGALLVVMLVMQAIVLLLLLLLTVAMLLQMHLVLIASFCLLLLVPLLLLLTDFVAHRLLRLLLLGLSQLVNSPLATMASPAWCRGRDARCGSRGGRLGCPLLLQFSLQLLLHMHLHVSLLFVASCKLLAASVATKRLLAGVCSLVRRQVVAAAEGARALLLCFGAAVV